MFFKLSEGKRTSDYDVALIFQYRFNIRQNWLFHGTRNDYLRLYMKMNKTIVCTSDSCIVIECHVSIIKCVHIRIRFARLFSIYLLLPFLC